MMVVTTREPGTKALYDLISEWAWLLQWQAQSATLFPSSACAWPWTWVGDGKREALYVNESSPPLFPEMGVSCMVDFVTLHHFVLYHHTHPVEWMNQCPPASSTPARYYCAFTCTFSSIRVLIKYLWNISSVPDTVLTLGIQRMQSLPRGEISRQIIKPWNNYRNDKSDEEKQRQVANPVTKECDFVGEVKGGSRRRWF